MKPTLNISQDICQIPAGPPSPTLSTSSIMSSVSWMAEKTANELIPMLKNAYIMLKDKEKNLMLAAEIGKSLLEHNLYLKSRYDALLRSTTSNVTSSKPVGSEYVQDEPIIDNDEDDPSMQFIPSRITREAIIEVLNRKNAEITRKLDLALLEQDKLTKNNTKNTRMLEKEISLLKSNLEIATTKMQELEEMNEKQRKQEELAAAKQERLKIDEELVEELYNEVDKMEQEKQAIIKSKSEVEIKLSATLKDLGALKKQFENFELTENDFNALKKAYQRQFTHIEELNKSLEEHRTIIQQLKERDVNMDTEAISSTSGGTEETSNKQTLLGELENEYFRNSIFNSSHNIMNLTEKSLSAMYGAPSLIGLENMLSKATGMDPQIITEAINIINQIESDHFQENCPDEWDINIFQDNHPKSDLYPSSLRPNQAQLQIFMDEPKSFTGKIHAQVQKLFNLVWRWCRFSVILTTALLVNTWHGPDSLLITY